MSSTLGSLYMCFCAQDIIFQVIGQTNPRLTFLLTVIVFDPFDLPASHIPLVSVEARRLREQKRFGGTEGRKRGAEVNQHNESRKWLPWEAYKTTDISTTPSRATSSFQMDGARLKATICSRWARH